MSDQEDRPKFVLALTLGGETSVRQRERNWNLYKTLKDGDGTGDFRSAGLAGFTYVVPLDRIQVSGGSAEFQLDKDGDCFARLLHVISDHMPATCATDDELASARARVAELEVARAADADRIKAVVNAAVYAEMGEHDNESLQEADRNEMAKAIADRVAEQLATSAGGAK